MNQRILDKLKTFSAASIVESSEFRGDPTIVVNPGDIVRICRFLKEDEELAFDLLVDLCGVDMYRPEGRFEVVYNLYSIRNKQYLRLKVRLPAEDPTVDTVCFVWSGANWHEREAYDLMGVRYRDHPDLRRILLPETWRGHPLRSDYDVDQHERETFDMFGIVFKGHPDLRRMYMPEEYEHYPLRKDYPLMGIPDAIPLPRK